MSLSILIKPASGNCNMQCKYCFYIDETNHKSNHSSGFMTLETLDVLFNKICSSKYRNIFILFQGGEPTLAGIDFYHHLSKLIKDAPSDFSFHMAFQTNGLKIDKNWATWFKQNNVLVGISLDGPSFLHDRNRVDKTNNGTFDRVLASIDLLKEEHVDFNILCVVTKNSVKKAKTIYRFFKQNSLLFQQYIECLTPLESKTQGHTPSGKDYGRFLKDLFDEWYSDRKSSGVYNRYFEDLLMITAGKKPGSCNMQGQCSEQWVVEADGSVYPCDFYCLDQWKLGNILTDNFEDMNKKRKELKFIDRSLPIPKKCNDCLYYKYCKNGCMRLRNIPVGKTIPENIFCESFKEFLPYAIPKLEKLLGH